MTGGPFGRAGGKPHLSFTSSTPSSRRRKMGAVSVGQMSSRGSKFGGGFREYYRRADLAEGLQIGAVGHVISKVVAHP